MLLIRTIRQDDIPALALLARVSFSQAFSHTFRDQQDLLDYLDRTFSVKKLSNSLQKMDNHFWMAFYDGLPVAYAKLKFHSSCDFLPSGDHCQLQKIYVLQEFLSKKIGLQLLLELEQKARQHEFKTIWLSVYQENKRAIRFYEKTGYEKVGAHHYDIGKEHFKFQAMAKKLFRS